MSVSSRKCRSNRRNSYSINRNRLRSNNFQSSQSIIRFCCCQLASSLRHQQAVGHLQHPQARHQSFLSAHHRVTNLCGIRRHRAIYEPSECYARIENERTHVRPSSIKLLTVTPVTFFDRLRIFSISSNTCFRSTCSYHTGPHSAMHLPPFPLPIHS